MDFFYKAPAQRPDECKVLEMNYMNCLLQKAMKDRVMNNRCVMDSILWFHMECPVAAQEFDNPTNFKLKFRDLFASTKRDYQMVHNTNPELDNIREEYDTNRSPDDIRYNNSVGDFLKEQREFDPVRSPEEDPDVELY